MARGQNVVKGRLSSRREWIGGHGRRAKQGHGPVQGGRHRLRAGQDSAEQGRAGRLG